MIRTHPNINAVIDKYRNLIYAICKGVVDDAHLLDDIVQDVIERIIRKKDTILELNEAKQVAYISVIAKNRAIDVSKMEKTQQNIVGEIMVNRPVTMDSFVNDTFTDEYGFSIEIRDLIFKLDDLERDIIILRYGFGYTYRVISDLLDINQRQIYYKSKTAHDKLYEAIKEGGVSNER